MKTPIKAKLVKGKALKMKAAPARTAAVKVTTKATTVTINQLAKDLAETHAMPKKQAGIVLADFTDMIAKHLKKGARVRINGIGVLQVRKRPARMGRNPATGEAIKIKASKKVAFRPARELKEAVQYQWPCWMTALEPSWSFVAAPADGRVNQKAVGRNGPAPNSPSQLRQCRIGVQFRWSRPRRTCSGNADRHDAAW